MKSKFFIPFLLIFINLPSLFSNSWCFSNLSYDFPSKLISVVKVDSTGSIWLGTLDSGVIKYDGSHATVFNSIPFDSKTLQNGQVQSMYMELSGTLWVGTYSGLSSIDTISGKIENYPLDNAVVCTIKRDSMGRLWVGTLNGLYLLDEVSKTSIRWAPDEEKYTIPDGIIRTIFEDSTRKLYVCTYKGVFCYNEGEGFFESCDLILPENPVYGATVYGIHEEKDHSFWFACWEKGLVHVKKDKTFTQYLLPTNTIYSVDFTYDKDFIFCGTWTGGLQIFSKKDGSVESCTKESFGKKKIAGDTVTSVFHDGGILWIGTKSGISIYDKYHQNFKYPTMYSARDSEIIQSNSNFIDIDDDDVFWIGRNASGIVSFSQKEGVIKEYTNENGGIGTNVLYCTGTFANKKRYAGGVDGLYVLDEKADSFKRAPWYDVVLKDITLKKVVDLIEDRDGSLWIGTYDGGLIHFSNDKSSYVVYKEANNSHSIGSNLIYTLFIDSQNVLWVGTHNGLSRYNKDSDSFITKRYDSSRVNGIVGNGIISLCEKTPTQIAIGTKCHGFCLYDINSDTFKSFTTRDGLPSNMVTGMYADGISFYVSTTNGLCQFSNSLQLENVWNSKSGLFTDFFTDMPAKDSFGALWFPSAGGIVSPLSRKKDYFINKRVSISKIQVNGEGLGFDELQLPNFIEFKDDMKNFTFYFTAHDYSPFFKTLVEYKLEGYDSSWNTMGLASFIRYTNLNPGKYCFKVRDYQAAKNGIYAEDTFNFVIQKPFYFQWKFILLEISIVILFIIFLIKLPEYFAIKRNLNSMQKCYEGMLSNNKELQKMSYTDPLTKVGNRRKLTYDLRLQWPVCASMRRKIAFFMMDIDDFKIYNDTYGHLAGDSILRDVSEVIHSIAFHNNGVLYRYGGEEFLMVIPDCSKAKSVTVGEKICMSIKNLQISCMIKSEKCLTISGGICAGTVEPNSDWELFIKKADEALYVAKANGKNHFRQHS